MTPKLATIRRSHSSTDCFSARRCNLYSILLLIAHSSSLLHPMICEHSHLLAILTMELSWHEKLPKQRNQSQVKFCLVKDGTSQIHPRPILLRHMLLPDQCRFVLLGYGFAILCLTSQSQDHTHQAGDDDVDLVGNQFYKIILLQPCHGKSSVARNVSTMNRIHAPLW
jgi:hypothetical protein